MSRNLSLEQRIFSIQTEAEFTAAAIEVFQFQYRNNPVYRAYVDMRIDNPNRIQQIEDIPFLPISFFKSHTITSVSCDSPVVFESSGTSMTTPSKHFVCYPEVYHTASRTFFEQQYGSISDYLILALLPSYLERNNSSLVYMVEQFIRESRYAESGFFLRAEQDFLDIIAHNTDANILCIGVSFALLDVAEKHTIAHPNLIVMETGGMKGRKKELVRADLHTQLQQGFQVSAIHSEYGMTELLSQSYAQKDGIFTHPAWMKILIRDMYDPFSYLPEQQSGGMNIIDLANLYSCSFIETQDIGKKQSSHTFTVEGRIDAADVRGCSLMV